MTQTRWRGQCRSTSIARLCLGLALVLAVGLPLLLAVSTDAFTAGLASAASATATVVVPVVFLVWAGMTFSPVRVVVDEHQVRVACGPWGHPRWSRRRDELELVEATTLSAARWGGWGWRWSGRGTAVLLCSGPALRLVPRDGRPFRVSLDDPGRAVAALEPLAR